MLFTGAYGRPVFIRSSMVYVLFGALISLSHLVTDQFACARLSQNPIPPKHALNRGWKISPGASFPKWECVVIFLLPISIYCPTRTSCNIVSATAVNGICLILQGFFGIGCGLVSYPQNIALLAVSRVNLIASNNFAVIRLCNSMFWAGFRWAVAVWSSSPVFFLCFVASSCNILHLSMKSHILLLLDCTWS